MRALKAILCATALALLALPAAASADPAPAWNISSLPVPSNFVSGDEEGDYFYEVRIANEGGTHTNGNPVTITDVLPAGLTVKDLELPLRGGGEVKDRSEEFCSTETDGGVETVTCTVPSELQGATPARLGPSEQIRLIIYVAIPSGASGELVNFASVQGGGAPAEQTSSTNQISETPTGSGFEFFRAKLADSEGELVSNAGSHPYQYTTTFAVQTKATPPGTPSPFVPAGGDIKTIEVELPPGLVGNPEAAAKCSALQFNTSNPVLLPDNKGFFTANECPNGSAVGVVVVEQVEGRGGVIGLPLYNLDPPPGMPAQFGFQVLGAAFFIDTFVRTGDDYGITAILRNVSEVKRVTSATVTIWGEPAAAVHDPIRGTCLNQIETFTFDSLGSCPAGIEAKPFFRLPTSCTEEMQTTMRFDTWTTPGSFVSATSTAPAPENCAALNFDPTITAEPTTSAADSPAGLRFNLHLPQPEEMESLATADLRDAVVTLPAGVSVNPASATGLAGCSPSQIELNGPAAPRCPDASKVGSVEVHTPLLDHPVPGSVYVATQSENPFGSLIAIYIVAHDPATGVVLKLPGEVILDQASGQITTRFTDNPQLPFEDLSVTFFDGPRAPLRMPTSCGDYTISTSLTPWSAPESGPPATPSDSFSVTSGPAGGPCPDGSMQAALQAGLQNRNAGSSSPYTLRLTRPDGSQELASVQSSPPPGLLAKLAGVPYCPEAGISQAAARNAPGQGAAELAAPSCPAASRVGSVLAGAGAGPSPYFTAGDLYLAGPYKGAPLSLVAVIPAVAGPFDLGVVANRIALHVDRTSARVTAQSDPLPRILSGIPLDVRDIRISLDRPGFMRAPTNCEPMATTATLTGVSGGAMNLSDRFQVGTCKALGFAPKLSLAMKGKTSRGGHLAVKAVLTAKGGEANIASTMVTLPPSQQIDNAHINNPCTRVQFNAGKCPPASVLGRARAFSPLLDKPLEGPVYFRSNGGERQLPDIVAHLQGQIEIVLVGAVDSRKARLRTRFMAVPDAPVSKFVLNLTGGKKGLLVNNRNLCSSKPTAKVAMKAHNGRQHNFNLQITTSCGKKKGATKKR